MKRFIIATLLASAAMTGSTFGQTAPGTAGEPATPTERMDSSPASSGGMNSTMASSTSMQSEGGFFTYQEGSQMLGSGLMGANVLGAEGEDIGDVEDLLLDQNGQIMAVVVGVGGFLGIGEKDVAIANDQLEFVLAEDAEAMTGATPTTGAAETGVATTPAGATTTAPAGSAAMGTAPVANPDATAGTTAMGTAGSAMTGTGNTAGTMAGTSNYGWGWTGAGIDHIQVAFTRDQLEDAPAFEYAD